LAGWSGGIHFLPVNSTQGAESIALLIRRVHAGFIPFEFLIAAQREAALSSFSNKHHSSHRTPTPKAVDHGIITA